MSAFPQFDPSAFRTLASAKAANPAKPEPALATLETLAELAGDFGCHFQERAGIAQIDGGIPAEWVDGFAQLQTMAAPGDMRPDRWREVINDAGLFLDRWAVQASALGWGTLDLFGIHERKPHGAIHCSGLVVLIGGCTVTAITADTCTIRHRSGTLNRYHRRAAQAGQVPLWECKA